MTAVIEYDAGNIRSVIHALERLDAGEVVLTSDPAAIRAAERVILPGVGDASVVLASLRKAGLAELVCSLTQPVLGICAGMQILCSHSEEGDVDGLGIFRTQVKRFRPDDPSLKVPHMGWNNLQAMSGPLFEGLPEPTYTYFVHSFYAEPCEDTIALCTHGVQFSAALRRVNFFGTQFHPEKSGPAGAAMLANFMKL